MLEMGYVIMKIFDHFIFVFILSVAMIIVSPRVFAVDDNYIIDMYDQFNVQLVKLNLSEASSFIESGEVSKAISIYKKADVASLNVFYSERMKSSNQECYSHAGCKESDLIFLGSVALAKREFTSVESVNEKLARLAVRGVSTDGSKTQVVLSMVFENGQWQIDEIKNIPYEWDPWKKPFENLRLLREGK